MVATPFTEDMNGLISTPTVERTIDHLKKVPVTSWRVVEKLLLKHPEYGRGAAKEVADSAGPKLDTTHPASTWIRLVSDLFEPSMVPRLHGRLVILGLCRIRTETKLFDYLNATGILSALEDELFEDFASLLRAEEAGPQSYRGEFMRALQNRAKGDKRLGIPRTTGLLVVVDGGPGLRSLAELSLRQKYNRCITARYVIPAGAGFARFLADLVKDLQTLTGGEESTIGDLLPEPPVSSKRLTQILKARLPAFLDTLKELDPKSDPKELLHVLLRPLDESVLKMGERLVLLVEYRGVREDASAAEVGLTQEVVETLQTLPERMALVFSGLPVAATAALNGLSITLPPDPELTRAQPLSNDLPTGPDRLNIATEVRALAEGVALKDMDPPMVVGVLGGWGSGKSFVLHLLEQRLKEIRCEKIPDNDHNGADESFPFVGHPYVIRFDAWTFAKSDLWASLMQTIFEELDRQISLEQLLQQELEPDPRKDSELWRVLSGLTNRERERLTKTDLGHAALQLAKDHDSGVITEHSLWEALAAQHQNEETALKQAELDRDKARADRDDSHKNFEQAIDEELDRRARHSACNSIRDELIQRVGSKAKELLTIEENGEGVEPPTFEQIKRAIGIPRRLIVGWKEGLIAFLIIAVALLAVTTHAEITASLKAIGSLVTGGIGAGLAMVWRAFRWLNEFQKEYEEDREQSLAQQEERRDQFTQELLLSAQQQGAATEALDIHPHPDVPIPNLLERAKKFNDCESKFRRIESEVAARRRRVGMTVCNVSLLDFVKQRLEGRVYEDRLGLLHQVQGDFEDLSSSLLEPWNPLTKREGVEGSAQAGEGGEENACPVGNLFPRGIPRVVLMIDDLDRCPPHKVVEVLEAVQLLVKQKLFVVVLAMDVRYVTRALEKRYSGVLVRGGEPSGLDYIEKIIQVPYRVRSVSAPAAGSFLRSLMEIAEIDEIRTDEQPTSEPGDQATTPPNGPDSDAEDESSRVVPARAYGTEEAMLPTEVIKFSNEEHRLISISCSFIELSPRAMKRLVNVFKLMKIIWYRQGLPKGPDEEVKRAVFALLVLAARYPEVTRQLLRYMESVYHRQGKPWEEPVGALLASKCDHAAHTATYPMDWQRVGAAIQNEMFFPAQLTLGGFQEMNFNLVSSFSFVGESDLEREAALRRGVIPARHPMELSDAEQHVHAGATWYGQTSDPWWTVGP